MVGCTEAQRAAVIAMLGFTACWILAVLVFSSSDKAETMNKPKTLSTHHQFSTVNGKDLGGVTQREGLSINWAGSDPQDERVRPLDVIVAAIDRIQAEQKTDLGSDENARALVDLMQARDKLMGEAQDVDGIPVIR